MSRSHIKKVFSPELGVETSSQVLDILQYACGLRLGLAFLSRRPLREISDKNPNFEMASIKLMDGSAEMRSFQEKIVGEKNQENH